MSTSVSPSTALLGELLTDLAVVPEDVDRQVTGLSMDSRTVTTGQCFLACQGSEGHGGDYISDAIKSGAAAVLVEAGFPLNDVTEGIDKDIPIISVEHLHRKVGLIADRFYHHPSDSLTVIGVTGTNGKTSVCHFIAQMLDSDQAHGPCGVIGTLGAGLPDHLQQVSLTTPDPVRVHQLLVDFRDQEIKTAAMEMSSHGLTQHRLAGVSVAVAVFTNLTRDHLDYHGDMASYAEAKMALFRQSNLQQAVINFDDPLAVDIVPLVSADTHVLGYSQLEAHALDPSLRKYACLRAEDIICSLEGAEFQISGSQFTKQVSTKLLGYPNVSNVLAAIAVLTALAVDADAIVDAVSKLVTIPGRMEVFHPSGGHPTVVVDFAHTPDSLEKALSDLHEVCTGEIWSVFGCGGDRDPGKRAQMGYIAEQLSDHVILTDDNPRKENPEIIINDILLGMYEPDCVQVEQDRQTATINAIAHATQDDIVYVAGKGHEEYQEIAGEKLPYSDRKVVKDLLQRPIS